MLITIEIECPFCGCVHYVDVIAEDFWDWQDGRLAQDCFPYLDATEREQLISNICPDCQKSIFRKEI